VYKILLHTSFFFLFKQSTFILKILRNDLHVVTTGISLKAWFQGILH